MSTQGAYRLDGSWVGFDYDSQTWTDTAPYAKRDATCKPGSACNPLPHRNPVAVVAPEVSDWLDPDGALARAGLMRSA